MSSGTSISEAPGQAAAMALVSLGSFPLLGSVFTGFVLSGLFGFKQALVCLLLVAAAGIWLRVGGRAILFDQWGGHRDGSQAGMRNLAGGGLVALWGAANITLYALVLRSLCGDAWFMLLSAGAALAWAARSLRQTLPTFAAGIALLAFHPVCLGLIASCADASTWQQLFAASTPGGGFVSTLASAAWVVLATLASEWHQPASGTMAEAPDGWRMPLASCLLLKLPACFLGLLAGVSYYDVHGFRAGFVETISWVVRHSNFCARWFVVLALMAGFLALVRKVFGFLFSENWGWLL